MFGVRYLKAMPTQFVIQHKAGQIARQGPGLSFWYYEPSSSIAILPTGTAHAPFMFEETTSDFQEVTIQGQTTYRIVDPERTAQMLNFTVDRRGAYVSDDPDSIEVLLSEQVQVAIRAALRGLNLRAALASGDVLVDGLLASLKQSSAIVSLGIDVLGLSILAIRPTPETARALEAETREQLLKAADEAIYARRNAAIEQERAIRENELATEVAVENKKRQVREAAMDAERAVLERRIGIQRAEMAAQIEREAQNRDLVELTTANQRAEADAKAYGIDQMMKAFEGAEPKLLQALASVGMNPQQLMALAFRDLADNAGKIGQLNMSPDLLREMLQAPERRG
ncbi:SPFH domain-containing protein [Peteryoungia ipomoeae]|uniref:SPFH domain-containing protein n=1 Tax=Peteryoungia ipomoeae TaxID=1210932 RepID=A0A4S8P5F7_9HYPH|nr:SPFH domain-containing protein [Peteryoungia ipomoeae]THV25410.1 SPFH domain-containing protein [Peteryoungia ipomoeae]